MRNAGDRGVDIKRLRKESRQRALADQRAVAGRIKEVMAVRGVQQKELAADLGITESAMCRYLGCERMFFPELVEQIACSLGVTYDMLVSPRADDDYAKRYKKMCGTAHDVQNARAGSGECTAEYLSPCFDAVQAGLLSMTSVARATGMPYSTVRKMYSRYLTGGKEYLMLEETKKRWKGKRNA